jgi:cytochrome c-type biogenesis protein CcmH/NrfG
MKRTLPDPEWKVALDSLIVRTRARVERRPHDPESWVALAMMLDDAWRDHESMTCYAKALELAPDDRRILRLMDRLRDAPEPKSRAAVQRLTASRTVGEA